MNYSFPPRKFPTISTNIQKTLYDHLPTELEAVLERINIVASQLKELHEYKTWLERVAEASEICITEDRLKEQSSSSGSSNDEAVVEFKVEESEKDGDELVDSVKNLSSDRGGL